MAFTYSRMVRVGCVFLLQSLNSEEILSSDKIKLLKPLTCKSEMSISQISQTDFSSYNVHFECYGQIEEKNFTFSYLQN